MSLEDFFSKGPLKRFENPQLLGKGSAGEVYRATRGHQSFAIKVSRAPLLNTGEFASHGGFYREAAALAKLAHPGVPRVMEVGETSQFQYIVMEYFGGRSLAEVLRKGPLDEGQAVRLARGLCEILAVAHGRGLVHRDVKPSNIIISENFEVKLIDFSLSAETAHTLADGEAAGTFLYGSPEQIGVLHNSVDGRSDLYSLGVVLFECVSGRLPFQSENVVALAKAHASVIPPWLCDVKLGVSQAFSGIVAKLLSKDPEDRYQSAEGLQADILRIEDLNASFTQKNVLPQLGSKDGEPQQRSWFPMVGRQAELAQILRLWQQVNRSAGGLLHPRSIVISGAPGSGKSRLMNEACLELRALKVPLLSVKCDLIDSVPFGTCRHLIQNALAQVTQLPEPSRQALASALRKNCAPGTLETITHYVPEMSETFTQKDVSPEPSNGAEEEGAVNAFASFISEFSDFQNGMVAIVDDLQWIDEQSLRVIAKILSCQIRSRLILMCTARDDEDAKAKLKAFQAEVTGPYVSLINLPNLSPYEVRDLVRAYLDGFELNEKAFTQIAVRTEGNPFAIKEFLGSLLDSGCLRPDWGNWILDEVRLEKLQLPRSIREMLLRRVKTIDEKIFRILQSAALMRGKINGEVLESVCQLTAKDCEQGLKTAARLSLLEKTEDGKYAFIHDCVREALIEAVPSEQAKEIHAKIAASLEAQFAEGKGDCFDIAHHFVLGRNSSNLDSVVRWCLLAGKRAFDSFAYELAYEYLEHARSILSEKKEAFPFESMRAYALTCQYTSRHSEAIETLRGILKVTHDPIRRAEVYTEIALVYQDDFSFEEGLAELVLALHDLGYRSPAANFVQVLKSLAMWIAVAFVFYLNVRPPTLNPENQRKFLIHLGILNLVAYSYYVLNKPFPVVVVILKSMWYAWLLEPSRQSSKAFSNYAGLSAILRLRNAMNKFNERAVASARSVNAPDAVARASAVTCLNNAILGDLEQATGYARDVVENQSPWLGTEYFSLTGLFSWDAQLRGQCLSALPIMSEAFKRIRHMENTKRPCGSLIAFRSGYISLVSMLGRAQEADAAYEELLVRLKSKSPRSSSIGLASSYLLTYFLEKGELGAPVDEIINRYHKAYPISPLSANNFQRDFYVLQCTVYAERCIEKCDVENLSKFAFALKQLSLIAMSPAFKAHFYLLKGVYLRLNGKLKKAYGFFEKAQRIAEAIDAPIIHFEVKRQRAFLAKVTGKDKTALGFVREAVVLAQHYGWKSRERRLQLEFGLDLNLDGNASVGNSVSTDFHGRDYGSLRMQQALEALLQISGNAVVGSADAAQSKMSAVLDKIIELLGADRAFLFTPGEKDGQLRIQLGRDVKGRDLDSASDYSTGILEEVSVRKIPLVGSTSSHGMAFTSRSILANDLKSVIAAPLLVREKLMGVVYLDTKLVRGMFSQEDASILVAMANHLAFVQDAEKLKKMEIELVLAESKEARARLEELGKVSVFLGDRLANPMNVLSLACEELAELAQEMRGQGDGEDGDVKVLTETIQKSLQTMAAEMQSLQKFREYASGRDVAHTLDRAA